jgi:rhodanese-related sulfurtransferase
MAWLLAGHALDHGQRRQVPPPSAEGLVRAEAGARRVAERFGVWAIDHRTLARYQAERNVRSLYLLDVRTREEFDAGHVPGARWAPGGQLVQAVDSWIGTRNARIVLTDNPDGVRATLTASWLIQIGWGEVTTFTERLSGNEVEEGPERPDSLPSPSSSSPALRPDDLAVRLGRGEAVVLDLDSSRAYRQGHIPGAWFAIRARLGDSIARLPGDGAVVLAAADDRLAAYAATELTTATPRSVSILVGGTAAWRAAGLPLESGEQHLLDPPDDLWQSPYERADRDEAFHEYLRWEIGLLDQIARDGTVSFRRFD